MSTQNPDNSVVLTLADVTVDALGYPLFQRVYHCIRRAAEIYAPGRHGISVTRDPVTHERTGYAITLPDRLTAMRVHHCHDLARQCRPMPWAGA